MPHISPLPTERKSFDFAPNSANPFWPASRVRSMGSAPRCVASGPRAWPAQREMTMTRLHKFAVGTLVVLAGLAAAPALAATAYVKQDSDVLKNPNPASTVINSVDKGA